LRATIKSISTLPRLDVGELGDEIKPLGLREPRDGGALGVNPQARLTLLARADPVVCDDRLGHVWRLRRSLVFCGVPWRSVNDYTSFKIYTMGFIVLLLLGLGRRTRIAAYDGVGYARLSLKCDGRRLAPVARIA
jgi:hypothetical protein